MAALSTRAREIVAEETTLVDENASDQEGELVGVHLEKRLSVADLHGDRYRLDVGIFL